MVGRRSVLEGVNVGPTAHAGLWLDKFLALREHDENDDAKRDVLLAASNRTSPDGYVDASDRRDAMFTKLAETGSATLVLATVTGRMIVGLGAKGVIEAGIRLEHTWGVPYIPGSSIKGLAASAAHRLGDEAQWSKPDRTAKTLRDPTSFDWLFGTTDEQGAVAFHDAWWIPEKGDTRLPLQLDVMTPHHGKYYGGEQVAPSDFDAPVPVPFLTARGAYLVVVEGPKPWREAALTLIEWGLQELGIGAKTSSGYGRMSVRRRNVKVAHHVDADARSKVTGLVQRVMAGDGNITERWEAAKDELTSAIAALEANGREALRETVAPVWKHKKLAAREDVMGLKQLFTASAST